MSERSTILVLGGTGRTGRHLVPLALDRGHRVRVLARDPAKLTVQHPDLEVRRGSITESLDLDGLLQGVDSVISLLGDAQLQRTEMVNAAFVRGLVPAMRRQGVASLLYQAGGLSAPPDGPLPPVLRALRSTVARGYLGQHRDNEAVMRYLTDEAGDVDRVVHRAGIGSDGPSKGVLRRSARAFSVATFRDCAAYDLGLLADPSAIRTCALSRYGAGAQ